MMGTLRNQTVINEIILFFMSREVITIKLLRSRSKCEGNYLLLIFILFVALFFFLKFLKSIMREYVESE